MTTSIPRPAPAARTVPPDLLALIAQWPVGTRVAHVSGWTATVVGDASGERLGATLGQVPAHAIIGALWCVHVEPDGVELPPMWMHTAYLTQIGGAR